MNAGSLRYLALVLVLHELAPELEREAIAEALYVLRRSGWLPPSRLRPRPRHVEPVRARWLTRRARQVAAAAASAAD